MYCWNMPGPSCRVTSLFLHLHLRVPGAGSTTGLSRMTWMEGEQQAVWGCVG